MTRREFNTSLIYFSSLSIASITNGFSKSQYVDNQQLIGLEKPFLCGTDYKLLPEVFDAFEDMRTAAQKDGLRLWCTSGYRSFKAQKQIWNDKYKKIKLQNPAYNKQDVINCVIEYSSIPGTSRHHWGTDLDIVDAFGYETTNPLSHKNYQSGGEYQYLSHWLDQHAATFGFYKVYTEDTTRTGFQFEPWHYSYKKLSVQFLNQYLQIKLLNINELKSCFGSDIFDDKFISLYNEKFMQGINKQLL